MSEPLFQVTCPSCETTFEVTDPELVGQIVECPKCGGMILVQAPKESASERHDNNDHADAPPTPTDTSPDDDNAAPQVRPVATSGRKPVSHAGSDSNQSEDDLEDVAEPRVWPTRIILILSGIFCALLLVVLIFLLRLPQKEQVGVDVPADAEQEFEETLEQTEQIEEDYIIRQGLINEEAELASEQFDASLSFDEDDVDASLEEESDPELASGDESERTDGDATGEEGEPIVHEQGGDDLIPSDSGVTDDDTLQLDASDHDATEATSTPTENANDSEPETANQSEPSAQTQDAQVETEASESEETMLDDVEQNVSTTEVNPLTSLPSLKAQPQTIDITKRLDLEIASLKFPASPIGSVQLLSELAGAPVEFDVSSLILLRPSFRSELDLSLANTTIQDAFATLGATLKWKVVFQNDKVEIAPENYNPETFVEERFDVAALLALDATAPLNLRTLNNSELTKQLMTSADLVSLLTSLVAPEDWTDPDLAAALTCEENVIVVRHNAAVRKRVEYLLEQLHVLHDPSYKSPVAPELLIPEALCYENLNIQVAFNLFQPETLEQALGKIERSQKVIVMWDDAILNAFGAGRTSTTVAHIQKSPIHDVLDNLLEPLGLSYISLDNHAILVTTNERARDLKTIELHVVEEYTDDASGLWDLANEMKRMVAPNSWEQDDVAIWLDIDSGVWVIRQSEPVQREIRNWLRKRLSGETTPTPTALEAEEAPTQDDSGQEEPADVEDANDELPLEGDLDLSGLGDDLEL